MGDFGFNKKLGWGGSDLSPLAHCSANLLPRNFSVLLSREFPCYDFELGPTTWSIDWEVLDAGDPNRPAFIEAQFPVPLPFLKIKKIHFRIRESNTQEHRCFQMCPVGKGSSVTFSEAPPFFKPLGSQSLPTPPPRDVLGESPYLVF